MTWRLVKGESIEDIKLALGDLSAKRPELDVLINRDDASDVYKAAVIGSVVGYAKSSDWAKLALANNLERLASLIRSDVIDRQEKKREERKRR